MYPFLRLQFLGHEIAISNYNLAVGVGLIVAFLYLERLMQNLPGSVRDKDRLFLVIVASLAFGFISSSFSNTLIHNGMVSLGFHGLMFYGGLLGGLTSFSILFFFLLRRTFSFLRVCDLLVLPTILAHAFGRLGCFFAGCCYGKASMGGLGIVFPKNSIPYRECAKMIPIYPTQLFEAAFLFLLFFLIRSQKEGRFSIYLICYGVFRYIIEFLRGDNRGFFYFSQSPAQVISLALIIIGLFLLVSISLSTIGRWKYPAKPVHLQDEI